MSKTENDDTRSLADCQDCPFVAQGAEAFVRRKGSFHSKHSGHDVTFGEVLRP